MKRRNFIASAGAAVGTASALTAFPALRSRAADSQTWRMVTSWPNKFPGLGTGADRLAKRITDMSEGRLVVKVYAAGSLVPALQVFDAVSQGTADMGHAAAYYWKGKSQSFNFFTGVPFGLTGPELSAWIHYGGGQALYDEGYAQFDLKPFLTGNTGAQMGGWFRREIKSLDDLRGLRMRMPGLGGEMLRRVGAVAENMAGGDIFSSLESGRLDATEWVGPWNDLAFGFYKITKLYYGPGFHEPGSGVEAFVNKKKYDALPKDLQEVVASACRAECDAMLGEFNRRNGEALNVLIDKHGVKLRRFPDDVMKALADASKDVLGELEGADDLTRRTYESFRKFRDEAIGWSKLADQGYLDMRARML